MYDVVVIGAGPAGISAGIYAKRSNLNVLIINYGKSNLDKAEIIENYYGFPEGINGKELFELGIKQAQNLGIEIKNEEVINIEIKPNSLFLTQTKYEIFESKTIVIATGNKKSKPNIIRHKRI